VLIWRGWGILVALLALFALIATELIVDGLYGPGTYGAHAGRYAPLGLLPVALVLWPLGRRLNRSRGEALRLRSQHSLFFVRMEYWAVILAGASLIALVYSYVS
jgi:hypothetical protein